MEWTCSNCGSTNPAINNFCENCGHAKIDDTKVESNTKTENVIKTENDTKVGGWICSNCGMTNPAINNFCENCGHAKIDNTKVEGNTKTENIIKPENDTKVGGWICSNCGMTNPDINNFCENCGHAKIDNTKVEGNTKTENVIKTDNDTKVGGWICSNCGMTNPDINNFCENCGHAKIDDTKVEGNTKTENIIKPENDTKAVGWICSNCGMTNPAINNFCENCGSEKVDNTKISGWICSNCGMTNPAINNFCENCGNTKVENNSISDRFKVQNNPDGSNTILDNETGYTINHTEKNGYVAYNKNGDEIYHIHPDGNVKIKTSNGEYINVKNEAINIGTLKNNAIFTDEDGRLYTIKDGRLSKAEYIDETTKCKCVNDFTSGNKLYYDYRDNCFMIESSTGEKKLTSSDNSEYVLKTDGTYIISSSGERGTYVIDNNGNFIFKSSTGAQSIYNNIGEKIKYIDIDGKIYDFRTSTQIVTKNGVSTYSLIKHIEYDEEAYGKILSTLNNVCSSYTGTISGACSTIASAINSFPDRYSNDTFSNIGNNIEGHISLISSLSEMTNYSLLAYQTCDEDLRDGLYLLIDSLFGENETALADNFKNNIRSTIEDRNGDNVLEYKENTNFKILSENAIVDSIHVDDDNNKWYLNKNKTVIGLEGSNFKINYGGETFSVTYSENGVTKIKDSNGKPLSIFGDYNIDSCQYGGNQASFSNFNNYKLLNDDGIFKVMEKYFPNASSEEKQALFDKLCNVGCGYTAMGNIVMKKFEGQEDSFYNTFGYPMYNVKLNGNDNLSIDYNYEPVILDMFCHINARDSIGGTVRNSLGLHDTYRENVEKYLNDTYNISLDGLSEQIAYRSEMNYDLINMNGSLYMQKGGPHAMIQTGQIDDGKYIVSSWGKKFILDCTGEEYDQNYSTVEKYH